MVTIYISPGPPNVQIPNVDNEGVRKATRQLQALGFQVSLQQVGPFGNTVFNYSPSGQAPKGSTITLYYGLPSLGGAASGGGQPGCRGRTHCPQRGLEERVGYACPCSGSFTFGMATGPRLGRSPARCCTDEAT